RKPAAVGDPGELHVLGAALARGYLHREDLTEERFVSLDGRRMYRTGDLARWRRDGEIEFLGRSDGQVKLRGYRVELGEVEVALAAHPDVEQVAAVVRTDQQDPRLVAYLRLVKGKSVSLAELRQQAAAKLPEYMIPSAFVVLEEFPRTASG